MIARGGRRGTSKRSGVAVEFMRRACGHEGPAARGIGHEAGPVDAFAIIKARHLHGAMLVRKGSGEGHVLERVSGGRAGQSGLEYVPLFDRQYVRGVWIRLSFGGGGAKRWLERRGHGGGSKFDEVSTMHGLFLSLAKVPRSMTALQYKGASRSEVER